MRQRNKQGEDRVSGWGALDSVDSGNLTPPFDFLVSAGCVFSQYSDIIFQLLPGKKLKNNIY